MMLIINTFIFVVIWIFVCYMVSIRKAQSNIAYNSQLYDFRKTIYEKVEKYFFVH